MASINCELNKNSIINIDKQYDISQMQHQYSLLQYSHKSLVISETQFKQNDFSQKSLILSKQLIQERSGFDKEIIKDNLNKNKEVNISGTPIKVFFFEAKQFKQFEIEQFRITTSIKQFIDYSINSFFYCNYNFIPEKINYESYQIKLLKQNEEVVSKKIEYHHEIAQYFCQNLIIFRKKIKNSNLRRFIHLCPQYFIYQIHIPHQKSRHLLKILKNSTYSQIKSQILKLSKQQPNQKFILVTFHKMQLINQTEIVNQSHQKQLELIKIRDIDFKTFKNQIYSQSKTKKREISNPSNKYQKIEIVSDLGIFQGKIKLSIESQYIIQRYQKSKIQKIMQIFSSNIKEKRYLIKDIQTAYTDKEYLVLKFKNQTKRYQMSQFNQKEYFLQMIRQSRE